VKLVLLIEDTLSHQETILRALTDPKGTSIIFDVRLATTGTEALDILDSTKVDAIILDDSLPDMDALHLLSEISLKNGAPPIIMVTSNANERKAVAAMKRGALDYIVKSGEFERTLPMVLERAIETSGLEERIKVSERQYRELLEHSNDAIYILIGDRFRYVNQKFAEMFGWSIEQLIEEDLDYRTLIAPESRPLVEQRGERVRANQPLPTRYEFKAVRKNGQIFDVEVSVSYIEFDGQHAVLGIANDITARKLYEKTLLRKNHELSVLNAVAEAITQVRDLSAILEGVVERLIELLEVDGAGIAILDSSGDRFSSVHYRGTSETFIREMRSRDPRLGVLGLALETQELQVIEDIRSDDRMKHEAAVREGFRSAVALPLVSHERCSGVITVFTRERRFFAEEDISLFIAVARQIAVAIENARLYKKAREGIARLQALSEIARAIGSTLDVEGVFRIVGDRLQRLVPYRRIALNILRRDSVHFSVRTIDRPATGEAPVVRLHEPLKLIEGSPLHQALQSQHTVVVEHRRPVASLHPAYPEDEDVISAVVPIVADKTTLGVFVVSSDDGHAFRDRDLDLLRDLAAHMAISLKNARVFQDLERAYKELKDAKDQVVRSEKLQSLGELAAGVAHDFNNVLSAILGRAQMLALMLKDSEMLKSVRVIEKAALDGAGTVRRIQEFAKEKSEGEFVPINLNSIVRDAVDLTTTRVNDLGIGIDMQVELGEVALILGNPTELREVLTNLIYNAIDAMPHGGRLSVRTGAAADLSDAARSWFEVEDTGIGMDEETQRKIFDPFFTTKGTRGTGLGMSVSYGIVQRHRGEFAIASAKGQGTAIRVDFPSENGGAAEAAGALEAERHASDKPLRTARILVIDDDLAVRDVLADILRTGAHHVVAAATGQEGIELFKGAEFDIVFTDLGMPGMDGWEVAAGIKSISPRTPVGLITGWGSSIDDQQLASRGVDLIVSKPFRFNQVLELVAEAIEIRSRLGG
jgi:PAS domain S-box-containing protein